MSEAEVVSEAKVEKAKIATREYEIEGAQCVVSGASVTFNFSDGDSLTLDPGELPEETRVQALLFGVGTRVRNAYSGAKGSVAEAKRIAREEWEQLKRGNWVERAAGSGEDTIAPSVKLLAECLAEVTAKSLEACMTVVQRMDRKQRAGLRKDSRIAKVYEAKRPRKAETSETDLGSLFTE